MKVVTCGISMKVVTCGISMKVVTCGISMKSCYMWNQYEKLLHVESV